MLSESYKKLKQRVSEEDKFSIVYRSLIEDMKKAGWEQIRGDNDPYASISKKFTRKGLSLIQDVIELDQYNAILNARISGKILKNIELQDLDQLRSIIKDNGGFQQAQI